MNTIFCDLLLKWDKNSNHRPMPWKGEKDPYKIWLSEIILQQTRVEQGWAYYERFLIEYPTIQKLAAAKDNQVFKLWEGLGYYNRCRNLLFTARHIVNNLKGVFPSSYEDLLSLKGVGPYTAAAIASFAYNLPHAVVDGNVFRVFARYYGIHTPTDTKEGIQIFNIIASENLANKKAGIYNQALMDFGATVCKPLSPLCSECIMQKTCVAFNQNKVGQLPIKLKIIQKKKRYFDYFCFTVNNKWFIQKREQGDIWAELFQFYLVENEKLVTQDDTYFNEVLSNQLLIEPKLVLSKSSTKIYQQQLTHQLLTVRFVLVELKSIPAVFAKGDWVSKRALKKYAFPKTINSFLEEQGHLG
jgi:A/G-specific adenine glycosylase